MSELKPCPFCGSKADVSSVMADVILCSNVDCYFYAHYVSIKTWQSRPLEDALSADKIDELSAHIQAIIHEVQKYQPVGSPPPGDEVMLTRWIMSTLSARVAELETSTYCAYCGEKYPLDDKAATRVSEHIKTCKKHPMRQLEYEWDAKATGYRVERDALSVRIQAIIHEVQKYQPVGSPPPGDEVMLIRWIMSTLSAENAKLCEALKIYADPENWKTDDWGVMSVFQAEGGYGNPTKIAEEALK